MTDQHMPTEEEIKEGRRKITMAFPGWTIEEPRIAAEVPGAWVWYVSRHVEQLGLNPLPGENGGKPRSIIAVPIITASVVPSDACVAVARSDVDILVANTIREGR